MKRSIVFFGLLFFISFVELTAQKYGLDNTDPSVFTKYRIPDTDLRSIWFNTNFNFNSQKSDNSSDYVSYPYNYSNYNSNMKYNLNPRYYLLRESEARYLSLDANLNGSYSHQYWEDHSLFPSNRQSNLGNEYNANLDISLTYDNYINSNNIFYSLGSEIGLLIDDNKTVEKYLAENNMYHSEKNQNYSFSFGMGIGRVRNVTRVVSAIRFQERLKQLNLLDNDLTDNTIEGLARQFYKQSYFSNVYDRPDKYFWQDIEKTLSSEGVSLKGMNMYSDSYLKEVLNEVRFLRNEGFIAGAEVQLNYQKRFLVSTGAEYFMPEMFFTMGRAYMKYSHQINLNSQFNFDLSVSGGPNILKNPAVRQQYSLIGNIGYNYELTDRIVASINNSVSLSFWNYDRQLKDRTNNFTFMIRYFIEDNLSLNANYNWIYQDRKSMVLNLPINYMKSSENDHTINIGFTYYIDRGFLIK